MNYRHYFRKAGRFSIRLERFGQSTWGAWWAQLGFVIAAGHWCLTVDWIPEAVLDEMFDQLDYKL